MKLIRHATELGATGRRSCLAIGVFDGVHLGHQQIIRQTISDARQRDAHAVVVTFDRHPNAIVAPDRVPPAIYSQSQKIHAIRALGADVLLVIPFDETFSRLNGESFIRRLANDLGGIRGICVGADFVFGHKRSGDMALLRTLGAEMGFQVHAHAAVALDGQTVSSTRIREVIRAGDFDAASQMLGRAYSIAGTVVHGDHLGQKLGFPTANMDVSGMVLPMHGVYAARATLAGKTHHAVLNIGLRPTVQQQSPQVRVEVHLLEFEREIYGQELEIEFAKKLRDEKRFPSLDALREQIKTDIADAKRSF